MASAPRTTSIRPVRKPHRANTAYGKSRRKQAKIATEEADKIARAAAAGQSIIAFPGGRSRGPLYNSPQTTATRDREWGKSNDLSDIGKLSYHVRMSRPDQQSNSMNQAVNKMNRSMSRMQSAIDKQQEKKIARRRARRQAVKNKRGR